MAEGNLKKDRLSGIFMTALILLVISLSVARVFIANRLVESSGKLHQLDVEIAQLQDSNQSLAQSIRAPKSLTQIEVEAVKQGFVKMSNLTFLTVNPTVAMQTNVDQLLR